MPSLQKIEAHANSAWSSGEQRPDKSQFVRDILRAVKGFSNNFTKSEIESTFDSLHGRRRIGSAGKSA